MILVDTSGLLANYDRGDRYHAASARTLVDSQPRILSPFVLAELDYLISKVAGQAAELMVLQDVSQGAYQLESMSGSDIAAATRIIERYPDLKLGLADASIVVLAERYDCRDILTLDQRHFRAIRASDGEPFRLLPHDAA